MTTNPHVAEIVKQTQANSATIGRHMTAIEKLTSQPITADTISQLKSIEQDLTQLLPINEWVVQNALKHLANIIHSAQTASPIDESDITESLFALGMTRKVIWARVKHEYGNIDAYFNNHRSKRTKKPAPPKLRVVSNHTQSVAKQATKHDKPSVNFFFWIVFLVVGVVGWWLI